MTKLEKLLDNPFFWNIALVFLLLLCVLLYWPHLHLDFWNDEIYTLKHFTFTPIAITVSDYHAPNNHIFFNLINNIYLKIIGIRDLYELMDHPWKLRIVPLSYLLTSLILIYKIGVNFFTKFIGLLAVILAITTIPIFNFAFQIRGYGLSTLLLLGLYYSSFSYLMDTRRIQLVMITILSALLFYTVPSNLYPILGLLLFLGIYFLRTLFNAEKPITLVTIKKSGALHLILAIISGLLLGLLFYANIFEEVFFNKWVQPGKPFQTDLITSFYLPKIGQGFLSNRWPLLILFFIGFIFKIGYYHSWRKYYLALATILITPLLIVFVRGDAPPLRVFINLAPFFCLLLAIGIDASLRLIPKANKFMLPILIIAIIYSVINFQFEKRAMEKELFGYLEKGYRAQELYTQYYSAYYYPLQAAAAVKSIYNTSQPLIAIDRCEPHGIGEYLDKFQVPSFYEPNIDSLLKVGAPLLLITRRPNTYLEKDDFNPRLLSADLNYHTLILMNEEKQ